MQAGGCNEEDGGGAGERWAKWTGWSCSVSQEGGVV